MCCHTLHVAGLPACLPHAARAVVASVFATCGTYSGCQRVRHTRHVPISAHVSPTRLVLCTYRVRRSKRASTSVLVGCQCVCHTRHVAVAPPSVPDDCQRVCHTRHVALATTAVLIGLPAYLPHAARSCSYNSSPCWLPACLPHAARSCTFTISP